MNISLKQKILCLFSILVFVVIPLNLKALSTPKGTIVLQLETQKLMEELEGFAYKEEPLKALFTTNSPDAIGAYKNSFSSFWNLLERFSKNREEWEIKIKESKSDMTFRLYLATVQTALYSIYSRPEKYIGFLKLIDPSTLEVSISTTSESQEELSDSTLPSEQSTNQEQEKTSTKKDAKLKGNVKPSISQQTFFKIPPFEVLSRDWEIKAELMKKQAHYNIDEALKLNNLNEDAKILNAQLLALEGNTSEISSIIVKVEKLKDRPEDRGIYNELPSFLESWKAYIELSKNGPNEGEESLMKASAYALPVSYSKWASSYLKSLLLSKTNWIEYNLIDYIPLDDIDIDKLKENSASAISEINRLFKLPLNDVSLTSNIESLSNSLQILWDLDTDYSQQNLSKYVNILENMYKTGVSLERCINQWNQLALTNKKIAYFYLIEKSYCSITLYKMAEKTKKLLQNDNIFELLNENKPHELENNFDFRAKCYAWSEELKTSIEKDIDEILTQKPDFIYAKILDFEFHALCSFPQEALQKMEKIIEELKRRGIKKLTIFPDLHEIDCVSYFNTWKTFLALKAGDLEFARECLQKKLKNVDEWKQNQEKYLHLIFLNQKQSEIKGRNN